MYKKILITLFIILITSTVWAIKMGVITNGVLNFGKGANVYHPTSVSGNFIFIDGNNVVFYDTNNFIFGG